MPARLLCLHGHFYQPPRENPWIEAIEVQDSAEPFHDWNERIAAECYGPNGAARIKGRDDRIVDIVDNYLHLSFNFGATLLAWLERERPDVYARVLGADARSVAARGHGNALAQGYNHAILPLLGPRDRRTQIRWGLTDFERRFRRAAEGFWLPEAGADAATLEDLAAAGIRFTILSPYQALRVRPPGGAWEDARGARFDPTRPYRVRLGSRELVVFFYDGHIARELAFGGATGSPEAFVAAMEAGYLAARGHDEILTIAFDGETLGHHKKGGDETLARALHRLAAGGRVEVVNLGQALDRIPVEWEAEIVEGSSWSCAHGLERWRSDCGCSTGGPEGWNQRWRAPLRAALDGLRDRLAAIFEREGASLLADPWGARERYVEVVLDPERWEAADFVRREAGRALGPAEVVRALRLLEMERQALLMYTSCGWFFSELSGIETVQVLRYAARAIQLARDATAEDLEPAFEEALARAPSNVAGLGDGRAIYERMVRPSVVTLEGVGAHHAIAASAGDPPPPEGKVFCYRYRIHGERRARSGPVELTVGRIEIESLLTLERLDAHYCVLHFGAADFRCGLAPWAGTAHQAAVEAALFGRLDRLSLAGLIREVDRVFTGRDYGLRDLFLDERRRVAASLLGGTMARYEDMYLRVFEDNLGLMQSLREIDSPVPGPLRVAADVALSARLRDVTRGAAGGKLDADRAERELSETVALAGSLGARLHLEPVRRDAEAIVRARLDAVLGGRAADARAAELVRMLDLARRLGLALELWEPQNRLWDWATSGVRNLDRATAAELARALWFEPDALLARAGYDRESPAAVARSGSGGAAEGRAQG